MPPERSEGGYVLRGSKAQAAAGGGFLRRIRRLKIPALDRELAAAHKAMDGLRFVFRTGGLSGMDNGDVGDLIATAFMLDLICYEFLKNRLWVHQEELLTDPAPNDLEMGEGLLLTGSSASGKSTYPRTALLNALPAQSLCTAAARPWRGSAFYLYSSMALEDDLLAGESYYVTEIRSIRRLGGHIGGAVRRGG